MGRPVGPLEYAAFGDVVTSRSVMRPVIPALAALAWGERRRRRYWEQELLNALVIVERGWAKPEEMVGSAIARAHY